MRKDDARIGAIRFQQAMLARLLARAADAIADADACNDGAKPTSVRNWPMRSMKRRVPVRPAVGYFPTCRSNCASSALATAAASCCGGNLFWYFA